MSLTSSGSSFSDMAVYPVRSEKRTVTCFRSPVLWPISLDRLPVVSEKCELSVSEFALEISWAGFKLEPHSPQNLSPGKFSKLQPGQIKSNLFPHSLQNLRVSVFSVWQSGHFILAPICIFWNDLFGGNIQIRIKGYITTRLLCQIWQADEKYGQQSTFYNRKLELKTTITDNMLAF